MRREQERHWKIAKTKSSYKIDVVVAMAQACLVAVDQGRDSFWEATETYRLLANPTAVNRAATNYGIRDSLNGMNAETVAALAKMSAGEIAQRVNEAGYCTACGLTMLGRSGGGDARNKRHAVCPAGFGPGPVPYCSSCGNLMPVHRAFVGRLAGLRTLGYGLR